MARIQNASRSMPSLADLAMSVPGMTATGPAAMPGNIAGATIVARTRSASLRISVRNLSSGSATVLKQQADSLVEATRLHAAALSRKGSLRRQSNRVRGPVLSGVMDSKTGEMFFGQNSIDGSLPDNLHPILQSRLDDLGEATEIRAGVAGSHSEIFALNNALLAREAAGEAVTEANLSEFLLHNRALRGPRAGTGKPPRCGNCNPLTDGVTTVDIDEN